jgi:hypothetical protein
MAALLFIKMLNGTAQSGSRHGGSMCIQKA